MSGVRAIADGPVTAVITPSAGPVGRYLSFEMSLDELIAPKGSFVARVMGSNALAFGVNQTVQKLLGDANPPEKFWFIDDDHEFDDMTLMQLLSHKEAKVVQAITLRKQPPFHLLPFVEIRPMWDEQRGRVVQEFKNIPWSTATTTTGLLEVPAVGRGGLLVDASVFREIAYPWFTVGQIEPDEPMEDVYFSSLLREAGIPMYTDLGNSQPGPKGTGHTATVTAFPYRFADGSFGVELKWTNGKTIIFPMTMIKDGTVYPHPMAAGLNR